MPEETTGQLGPKPTILKTPEQPASIKPADIANFRNYVKDLTWESGHATGEQILSTDAQNLGMVRKADDKTITVEYFSPAGADFKQNAVATFSVREEPTDFTPEELADLGLEPLPSRPAWDFRSLTLTPPNGDKFEMSLAPAGKHKLMKVNGKISKDGFAFGLVYDYSSGRLLKGTLEATSEKTAASEDFWKIDVSKLTGSDKTKGAAVQMRIGTKNILLRSPWFVDFGHIIGYAFPKEPSGLPTPAKEQAYAPAHGKHWLNDTLKINLSQNFLPIPL
ncbi:MAG: hypothetical protein M1277_01840 [Patescibacteria group bacterium]|nr:hypothetical protein [Patescibacteria group bacterium]